MDGTAAGFPTPDPTRPTTASGLLNDLWCCNQSLLARPSAAGSGESAAAWGWVGGEVLQTA